MKWFNIKLIYLRELGDQLRDRRTLFTVAVMPMLLYPLMGIALLQVGQFMRQHPSRIWVVNAENLPTEPSLFKGQGINPDLMNDDEAKLIEFVHSKEEDLRFKQIIDQYRKLISHEHGELMARQLLQAELNRRSVDIVVCLTDPVSQERISIRTRHSKTPAAEPSAEAKGDIPEVFVFLNSASDKSRIAGQRLSKLLKSWETARTLRLLEQNELSSSLIQGMALVHADLADTKVTQAAMWSKILPFIVVIWALTGAFYPAIDLCAGEKERGTFETLLSSPAARSEIALGKLFTVISFSYATSLLNLISMGMTGLFVASKLGGAAGFTGSPIGAPPISSFFWLLIALVPISALFSAIALSAAAFARSSKEGQYYLVPLIMVSMPLMIIPMLPGAQLNLGTSLIPISGLIMLLRGLIEGQYVEVAPFVGPVCMVTLGCCWLAVKWVIAQFNSESVLFRPSEQFSLQIWFRSLLRERDNLPTLGNAVLCGVTILVCKFFIGFACFTPSGFGDFALQVLVTLIAAIAVPAVLMALILTRRPAQSLRLNLCSIPIASAAILAAILLNPLFTWLSQLVLKIYPPTDNLLAFESLATNIFASSPGIWATLFVFALAPAVCEEIGFRGFILSGMESLKSKWQAILITSFLFGVTHSVIHQTVVTFFVGIALGVIAVQTRSLIPCMLFHAVHNSMAVLLGNLKVESVANSRLLSGVFETTDGVSFHYAPQIGLAMGFAGLALLVWFWQLPRMEQATNMNSTEHKGFQSLPAVG
jgi:sodium transport system permease protein